MVLILYMSRCYWGLKIGLLIFTECWAPLFIFTILWLYMTWGNFCSSHPTIFDKLCRDASQFLCFQILIRNQSAHIMHHLKIFLVMSKEQGIIFLIPRFTMSLF